MSGNGSRGPSRAANLVAADQAEVAADPAVLVVLDQVEQDRAEQDPVAQDKAALAAAITELADRRRVRLEDPVDLALENQVDLVVDQGQKALAAQKVPDPKVASTADRDQKVDPKAVSTADQDQRAAAVITADQDQKVDPKAASTADQDQRAAAVITVDQDQKVDPKAASTVDQGQRVDPRVDLIAGQDLKVDRVDPVAASIVDQDQKAAAMIGVPAQTKLHVVTCHQSARPLTSLAK
jgi:hypothetical protein